MKVLLIQPPIRDFYRTAIRTQPIGLAYLASSLLSEGHEVGILDCQDGAKRSIPIPAALRDLEEFYPSDDRSPFKLYTGYYHFGMDWEEIVKAIVGSEADIFGISSSFTPYHSEALEIARIIKRWDPRKTVILGGAHVSSDPEGVLESPFVDYVVLGEGEFRLPRLVEELEKGRKGRRIEIDGIGDRTDGRITVRPLETFIEPLERIPRPARELLPLDRYRIRRRRATMIITSRGCPHRCAYCSAPWLMGQTFRARSPRDVLEEMVQCRRRFGIEAFDIEDDNFTHDVARAKRLMEGIVETFGESRLELSAMNGLSFASLDLELLGWMKRAGFRTVNLSYVSTASSTRQKMGRPGERTEFDEVLQAVFRVGLGAIVYGLFGLPGQTIEEMVDTLVFLMERSVLIGPSIYYPVPKTPLFERCKVEGILPEEPSRWRSSALPVETNNFDRLDLVTLFRLSRLINFIKGRMDHQVLAEGMTLRELSQFLESRTKMEEDGGEWPPWATLLCQVIRERSFFSFHPKAPEGRSLRRLRTSRRILDQFFEKAWESPILPSQPRGFGPRSGVD